MFEAALAHRIPESTLLSHDLLEGIFARAGLVSDIEVVEEFPGALRRRRGPPAPLGARRLAAAALDFWARPGFEPRPQPPCDSARSAAGRCSTTCGAPLSAPAAFLALLVGWMLPLTAASIWTRLRRRHRRDPSVSPGDRRHRAATTRPLAATTLARGRRRCRPGVSADRAADHARRPSGVADDRRHRSHAGASVRSGGDDCSSG